MCETQRGPLENEFVLGLPSHCALDPIVELTHHAPKKRWSLHPKRRAFNLIQILYYASRLFAFGHYEIPDFKRFR